jgi:hypothetical protein
VCHGSRHRATWVSQSHLKAFASFTRSFSHGELKAADFPVSLFVQFLFWGEPFWLLVLS